MSAQSHSSVIGICQRSCGTNGCWNAPPRSSGSEVLTLPGVLTEGPGEKPDSVLSFMVPDVGSAEEPGRGEKAKSGAGERASPGGAAGSTGGRENVGLP